MSEPAHAPPTLLLDDARNRGVVDGLRAVGILLVLLFHVMFIASRVLLKGDDMTPVLHDFVSHMPYALNIAWQALGSEIVFFLSGFLLSYLLLRELSRRGSIDVREFYVRRAARILPMYAVALPLYAIGIGFKFTFVEFLLNLVFLSKVFRAETIIQVGWSLEVLVQFYLLVPFLVLGVIKSRVPLLTLLVLLALSLAARYWALDADPETLATPFYTLIYTGDTTPLMEDLYYLLWYRATPFLFGTLIAYLVVHRSAALARVLAPAAPNTLALVVGLALIGVVGWAPIHDQGSRLYTDGSPTFWLWFWTAHRGVFTLGVALAMLACFYARRGPAAWIGAFFNWPVWGVVSRNIYGLFLYHFAGLAIATFLVFRTVERRTIEHVHAGHVIAIFLIGSVIAVGIARLFTKYLELPWQARLRERYGRRRPGPATTRAPS